MRGPLVRFCGDICPADDVPPASMRALAVRANRATRPGSLTLLARPQRQRALDSRFGSYHERSRPNLITATWFARGASRSSATGRRCRFRLANGRHAGRTGSSGSRAETWLGAWDRPRRAPHGSLSSGLPAGGRPGSHRLVALGRSVVPWPGHRECASHPRHGASIQGHQSRHPTHDDRRWTRSAPPSASSAREVVRGAAARAD
jgi:hypothetical protein